MFGKIVITGEIEVLTGMHIGGSSDFSAIGAIDSIVVRDSLTRLPIIPGSTLKGKMRYLLAKEINDGVLLNEPNKDDIRIRRLFGSSEKENIVRARLKFNDVLFSNHKYLQEKGVSLTEVKFENTIDRKTCVANPRQIERVVRGSKFNFDLFYEVENKDEIIEDFCNIKEGFKLLEFDYLGGNGTRGSGRVKINNLSAKVAVGEVEEIDKINRILGEEYED
ncbi:MAG: type III-A CRISPR-associated RAMP protein Csm3 [Clostridioides sp.]|jgi:CRISPR-associated protein Csm3|nr:type III-A CRISPR-associated RAMP protein Csm3 [Clostridioides sp.]